MDIVRRTNEHLHAPDEEAVRCYETKVGMKRQALRSQDSSHHIVGECLLTVSEGTAAKLPKLDSLKHHSEATRAGIGNSCTACNLGTAHTPTRVQANSKRRTVPPVRLWPGGTANPHFRDTAKPGDVAIIPGLVG